MSNITFTKNEKFEQTWLNGYIDCSYDLLVKKFGLPHSNGDEYKVDAEWSFIVQSGDKKFPVTIYNYKNGRNYLGADGKDVKDIIEWHIGGNFGFSSYDKMPESVQVVISYLKDNS